jgi:hypothetical protein
MSEESELIQQREELKRQLTEGGYETLVDVILNGTGRLIQKFFRSPKPPSFWYSAAIISLTALLIDFSVSFMLGEFYPQRREIIWLEITAAVIIFLIIIVLKIYIGIIFATLRNHLVETIELVADLADLQRWLSVFCNVKLHLFVSLISAIGYFLYSPVFLAPMTGGFAGFGVSALVAIVSFWFAVVGYLVLVLLIMINRLSRYQLKLYTVDPSSSEVIGRLSDMLANVVFIWAVGAAIIILILIFSGLLSLANILFNLVVGWFGLIIFFAVYQVALAKIITNAKWKSLNEIQLQIEELKAEENIASKETMETINRLMDYHDRVKATRNSVLDIRAGLNFLNSLLIPLLAFILANLDKVLDLFS